MGRTPVLPIAASLLLTGRAVRGHVVQLHQERSSACGRERFGARDDGVVGCCLWPKQIL